MTKFEWMLDVLVRIHATGCVYLPTIHSGDEFCGKLVGKCTRLQLCLIYIFGNYPPQMVQSAGSKYWFPGCVFESGTFVRILFEHPKMIQGKTT